MRRTPLILHLSNEKDELPKKIKKILADVDDERFTQFAHISYVHFCSLDSLICRLHITDFLSIKVLLLLNCDCIKFNKAIIQHIILCFPEVNIFFIEDNAETWQYVIFKTESERIKTKRPQKEIDDRCIASRNNIIAPFHQIPSNFTAKQILLKILNYDNIFDISSLRACTKKYKFEGLNIIDNYQKYTEYKLCHPAVSIDEESSTAEHIAYCLYACGYRALPISSYLEFRDIVQHLYSKNLLILRDFDLQFADAPRNKEIPYRVDIRLKESRKKAVGIYDVDLIRGYKRLELSGNDAVWIDFKTKKLEHYCWNIKLNQGKIYCVSQGYKNLSIDKNVQLWQINDTELSVPGIYKPLNGIYYSLYKANIVNKVRSSTRILPHDEIYPIDRGRIKHQHSLPLDLYNIARPLLERAKNYYLNKQFYLAAVLSQEAADIINGFHIGLMLDAYLIHAKAENAIAMDIAGCNEKDLAEDCRLRIELIKSDVTRLIYETDQDPQNILNQIFSDCRQYCKEKEHFESEDVFIAAMAELNEGLPLFSKTSFRSVYNKHKNFFKEKFGNFIKTVNSYGPENESGGKNKKTGEE